MKIKSKYYEYDNVTCNMISTRKTFYPVMCDDVQVADLEVVKARKNSIQVLNVTFKDYLECDTYHNIMDLLCELTRENYFEKIYMNYLASENWDLGGGELNEFPKFRRKNTHQGLVKRVQNYHSISNRIKIYLVGHYMFLSHENKMFIITEDTCKKLPVHRDIYIGSESISLPAIVYGDETLLLQSNFVSLYIDDIQKLSTLSFKTDPRYDRYFNGLNEIFINVYFASDLGENFKHVKLPDTSSLNRLISFGFVRKQICAYTINLDKDMFDFSNQKDKVTLQNESVILHNGL